MIAKKAPPASSKNIHRLIAAAVQELPAADAFLADLNASIEKTQQQDKRTPSATYKPSSMSCIRNMYFQITKADQDPERVAANFVGILQSGTDRHCRIQEAISSMKKIGIDCEYIDVETYIKGHNLPHLKVVSKENFETKLRHTGLNLSFMCDGIVYYKGHYYILEIKTETVYKFQSRQGVDESHLPQASSYALSFEIDDVLFLYENRDTCDKKVFLLQVQPDMKMDIVSKIETCDQYVSALTPPPKPKDVSKKTCTYCNYKTICQRVGA